MKMKIKVSFFGVLMMLALIFTHSYLSIAALLAALLHEVGHIVAAKICDIPLKEIRLDIFGAAITPQKAFCSYKKEIALAAAGPLVNALSFLMLFPFFSGLCEFVKLFVVASLFLGALNLLPISDFDGGRILYCLLAYKFSPEVALAVGRTVSFAIAFFLWAFSIYLLLRLGESLSLFVFSFALLCKLLIAAKN